MMRIYVASSWRNNRQPEVVRSLLWAGHLVYDFRNPAPGEHGFAWSEIDPNWKTWSTTEFRAALGHPISDHGFGRDYEGMKWANACVLVNPCGRSAHLEAGWFAGSGKPLVILLDTTSEAELMYKLTPFICLSMDEVLKTLQLPEVRHLVQTANYRDALRLEKEGV